ncbi:TetR/AcrR family transcriptional regulator [Mycobacterium sp. URHB0021]
MPRVTAAYRRNRRDEIALAAVRCLQLRGLADTSIADIVAESGLSTGAIYANFKNKAELARYVANYLLTRQLDEFEARLTDGRLYTPGDVLNLFLTVLVEDDFPRDVLVQFWGAATTDPELRTVVDGAARTLAESLAAVIHPWAATHASGVRDRSALAQRVARVLVVLLQGHMVNSALMGQLASADFVDTLVLALCDTVTDPQ